MSIHQKLNIPRACNAHLHIIDPAFPNDGKAAAQIGTVETYIQLAHELGLERAVFVQAKPFATDNACLLDAIQKFGPQRARGIAVVSFDMCQPLSHRVSGLGWNMQLHMSARQLMEQEEIVSRLPGKVVIDHMGRLDPEQGIDDPAYACLCRLIDRGNVWVKLCGPYLNTKTGYPWADAARTARALAAYAPERMLWGTDFPHVTEKVKPDEWSLLETIDTWFDTDRAKQLALVENPEQVYGFSAD